MTQRHFSCLIRHPYHASWRALGILWQHPPCPIDILATLPSVFPTSLSRFLAYSRYAIAIVTPSPTALYMPYRHHHYALVAHLAMPQRHFLLASTTP
ncbi:hypothetical protein ACLB2K_072313 [Fragaria x ananassa]